MPTRRTRPRLLAPLLLSVGAALATYFLDPVSGRRRRRLVRDRSVATARHANRRARRTGRDVRSRARGLAQRAVHMGRRRRVLDDVTPAHKVETVVFGEAHATNGRIDVDAVNIVTLRGDASTRAEMTALSEQTRRIPSVLPVENLLHVPGEPASHATAETQGQP
jgi:hypothetical protein